MVDRRWMKGQASQKRYRGLRSTQKSSARAQISKFQSSAPVEPSIFLRDRRVCSMTPIPSPFKLVFDAKPARNLLEGHTHRIGGGDRPTDSELVGCVRPHFCFTLSASNPLRSLFVLLPVQHAPNRQFCNNTTNNYIPPHRYGSSSLPHTVHLPFVARF